MTTAVIVDAIRTPLGRRNGKLKDWHPVDLAAETLKALQERNDLDPSVVDDVVMGCVMQVGEQAAEASEGSLRDLAVALRAASVASKPPRLLSTRVRGARGGGGAMRTSRGAMRRLGSLNTLPPTSRRRTPSSAQVIIRGQSPVVEGCVLDGLVGALDQPARVESRG